MLRQRGGLSGNLHGVRGGATCRQSDGESRSFAGSAVDFNLAVMRKVQRLGSGEDAPIAAKLMCATSLGLWIGIIVLGRFLAFFKPLFTLAPP